MSKVFTKNRIFGFCTAVLLILVVFDFDSGYKLMLKIKSDFFDKNGIDEEILKASLSPMPDVELDFGMGSSGEIALPDDSDPEEPEPEEQFLGIGQSGQEIQDQLDEIQEKIDIIKSQIEELIREREEEDDETIEEEEDSEEPETLDDKKDDEPEEGEEQNQENNNTQEAVVSSPSTPMKTVYPKILISEIQTAGEESEKMEFVELFNPNESDVVLSEWYVQKKTKTGSDLTTYAPSRLFYGKKILAKGYFVIAREDSGFNADILVDSSLSEDNTLVLKDPNRDVSDKAGWGDAQEYELSPAENPDAGKSIGRKIADGTEQDSNNNAEDFEKQFATPGAQNEKFIEEVPPDEPDEITDEYPPEILFNLEEAQNSLSFDIIFDISDPVDVTSSGLKLFSFRWKEGEGEWQEDIETEISGINYSATKSFTGENGKTYYFQAKASDIAGNDSGWLPVEPAVTQISVLKNLLINEIQISGQTAKDEFIELFNPNEVEIDLAGFALKKKTSGGTESNLVSSSSFNGKIAPLGYFLIAPEPEDAETPTYTGSEIPDLYYSGKSYSIAQDNTVLLYDKNEALLDKAGYGEASDYENLPAQNPDSGKSISRTEGIDTNDNSADFYLLEVPTPKAP